MTNNKWLPYFLTELQKLCIDNNYLYKSGRIYIYTTDITDDINICLTTGIKNDKILFNFVKNIQKLLMDKGVKINYLHFFTTPELIPFEDFLNNNMEIIRIYKLDKL